MLPEMVNKDVFIRNKFTETTDSNICRRLYGVLH